MAHGKVILASVLITFTFLTSKSVISKIKSTLIGSKMLQLQFNRLSIKLKKYALISALMSIFSGPLIESTFNIMDDTVEKDPIVN